MKAIDGSKCTSRHSNTPFSPSLKTQTRPQINNNINNVIKNRITVKVAWSIDIKNEACHKMKEENSFNLKVEVNGIKSVGHCATSVALNVILIELFSRGNT